MDLRLSARTRSSTSQEQARACGHQLPQFVRADRLRWRSSGCRVAESCVEYIALATRHRACPTLDPDSLMRIGGFEASHYTRAMAMALLIWCLLWFFIGLPWRSFRVTPSFRRVELIPFVGGSLRSELLNLLAFVPLGIIGTRLGWRPRTVILVGAAMSGLTELSQLFSSRRFPSTTDLILNIAGTVIGIVIARAWNRPPIFSSSGRR